MRRVPRIVLWCALLLLAAVAFGAERRFPPPDFETDYSFPQHVDPPARALAMGYVDVAILVAALGLASYLALRRRSRDGMLALTIGSLLYFGFYRKGCVCPIGAIQNVALAAADASYALPWVVLAFFLLPLVFALFFGRTFCAGVCPLGAIQDLAVARSIRLPRWLDEGLGLVPYLYLGWAVLLAATGTRFLICEYDPFVGFFRMDGPAGKLVFGGALLAIGVFIGRPYCRFLCPYGVLLRQAARLTRRHMTITPTDCIRCQLCEESCPFGAIDAPTGSAEAAGPGPLRHRALAALALGGAAAVLGGWACSRLAPHVVHMHPVAAVIAQQIEDADGAPVIPAPIAAQVAGLERRYRAGGWWVGAFLGAVLGGRLLRLSIRRRRDDFEINRPACVSCLRCVRTCPKERVRLGLPVPGLDAAGGPAAAAVPGLWSAQAGPAAGWDARVMRRLAVVAAASLVFFLSLLAWNQVGQIRRDPLKETRLAELRAQLEKSDDKAAVREAIRHADLEARAAFFRRQVVGEGAGRLVLWSAVLLLLAGKWLHDRSRPLPAPAARMPELVGEAQERDGARARRAVTACWGAAALAALAIGLSPAARLLPAAEPGAGAGAAGGAGAGTGAEPAPTDVVEVEVTEADISRNWPGFRGPGGLGLVREQVATGFLEPLPAVLWETQLPLPGFNSPVVWEGKVLLSGAAGAERAVWCVEGAAGAVLWTRPLPPIEPASEVPEVNEDTGLAAPTMVTDGRRAFALFANGDLFALALADGRVVWSRAFGLPDNHYGHATSLALHDDLLLVQLDQAYADDGKSVLYGLETATGAERYRVPRPVDSAWTSPIVARAEGGPQLITVAAPWLIAYRPQDGSELWRAECVEGETAPSPVFGGGMVFSVSPYMEICGVRADGSGEVTETHVAWKGEEGVPDITSPLTDGTRLWTVTTDGTLTCYELPGQEPVWQEELEEDFFASPTLCGDRLMVISGEGRILLFDSGSEFKPAGRIELEHKVRASPAFGQNRMYVRAEGSLICLGKDGTGASAPAGDE